MNTKWDIALLISSIIVIVVLFFNVKFNEGEGGKCLANPIQYGLEMYKMPDNEVICQCNYARGGYSPIVITWNDSHPLRRGEGKNPAPINFSNIKVNE